MAKVSVLFVCMGNICRSPTAQGVFRKMLDDLELADQVVTDSAGTHAYHVGNPPDQRAQETAERRGIDLSDLRARQVNETDFIEFDYILAMDRENYEALSYLCPEGMENRLRLFMEFAGDMGVNEVPDPYYGGPRGFEQVFDLVDAAARGLLEDIRKSHLS